MPEGRRAWHAGDSFWAGETDINSCSIGIEIANPGHDLGYPEFPRRQIAAVIALCRGIFTRHEIPPDRVLAHSDVAPSRKRDPGEKFPWKLLADSGIGLWVKPAPSDAAQPIFTLGDTDPAILKLLLAHGADPTVEDENGATPLSRAVSAGTLHGPDRPMFGGCRAETVRALIAHDPALRLKRNSAWNNAIWWARFQRCEDVLRLIGE